MPIWATVTLTLGVAIITAATSYINQHLSVTYARLAQGQANENDRQRQLRDEAYKEFCTFMLIISSAVDALIFAVRNLESSDKINDLTNGAVEKVRQVRIHAPLMLAYAGANPEAMGASDALVTLLGKATYSLRYHTGQTVAPGERWTVEQMEKALRPGADELQNKLATAVIQAISQPPRGKTLGSSRARGPDARTGLSDEYKAHRGRPASWVAVSIIIIGFIVGGIAMIVGPVWWPFWAGAGIVVIGSIFALSVGILDDWY